MSNNNSPQPLTLAELLEWRENLPGWKWRPYWDYLEELRRVCQWGRDEVRGVQLNEHYRPISDHPQLVPAQAFFDYRLDRQIGSTHGQLSDNLSFPKWQNLQFSGNACAAWQAALEADELGAPRSAVAALPVPPTPLATGVAPPAQTPSRRGKKGRRRGSGAIDDSELLTRMLALLATGTAISVNAAAQMVAHDAVGQSEKAKRDRLGRKFAGVHGVEPPPGKMWRDVQHEFLTK